MNSISINKSSLNYKKSFYLLNFYLIVLVLLSSGITKIIDPQPLIETIESIKLIEGNFVIALATLLPVVEITLGIILLLEIKIRITLRLVTALFVLFFIFSIYGFTIGLESDCGCLPANV